MILVVDNYDSFTYNLVQVLATEGADLRVVRNDQTTAEEILSDPPAGLLLSPGPGRPENAGICPQLVAARPRVPMLGVCLGHQVLGAAFGGSVERSDDLMHGKTSWIRHTGEGLFEGLSDPFEATRYHSLELRESGLDPAIEPVAWAESGTLMGIRHLELPYWGVQFHPESVLSVEGPRLLANFLTLCERYRQSSGND